jgi:hypothetical protein
LNNLKPLIWLGVQELQGQGAKIKIAGREFFVKYNCSPNHSFSVSLHGAFFIMNLRLWIF